jgi:hypothetical protein
MVVFSGGGPSLGGLEIGIVSDVPSGLKRYSTAWPLKENVSQPDLISSH